MKTSRLNLSNLAAVLLVGVLPATGFVGCGKKSDTAAGQESTTASPSDHLLVELTSRIEAAIKSRGQELGLALDAPETVFTDARLHAVSLYYAEFLVKAYGDQPNRDEKFAAFEVDLKNRLALAAADSSWEGLARLTSFSTSVALIEHRSQRREAVVEVSTMTAKALLGAGGIGIGALQFQIGRYQPVGEYVQIVGSGAQNAIEKHLDKLVDAHPNVIAANEKFRIAKQLHAEAKYDGSRSFAEAEIRALKNSMKNASDELETIKNSVLTDIKANLPEAEASLRRLNNGNLAGLTRAQADAEMKKFGIYTNQTGATRRTFGVVLMGVGALATGSAIYDLVMISRENAVWIPRSPEDSLLDRGLLTPEELEKSRAAATELERSRQKSVPPTNPSGENPMDPSETVPQTSNYDID